MIKGQTISKSEIRARQSKIRNQSKDMKVALEMNRMKVIKSAPNTREGLIKLGLIKRNQG